MKNRLHRGFTLIELLIAIAILMFGMFGVLAVFSATASKEAKIEDEYTAAIIIKSLAASIEIAFSSPLNPNSTVEQGPIIRIVHDGMGPEGFADITLPGVPDDPDSGILKRPEEIKSKTFPPRGTYRLGRFLREEDTDTPSTEEEPETPQRDPANALVEYMNQYSFKLTFRNWRTKYRSKVPNEETLGEDGDAFYHPKGNQYAFGLKEFKPEERDWEIIQTGNNRGYEVTIRVYRNNRSNSLNSSGDLITKDLEDHDRLRGLERFVYVVSSSFGVQK